jgi:hypothetical protein
MSDDLTTGRPATDEPGRCTERELLGSVTLCLPNGRLDPAAIGWARQPLIDCALPGTWGRRKRWDYWGITGPAFAMSITYADIDLGRQADVWFHDFERDATAASGDLRLGGRGSELHRRAGEANVHAHGKKADVSMVDEPGGTRLQAELSTAQGPFAAELFVEEPEGHESLTVVIPWSERRFQCTTKDVARPARGVITWGGRSYELAAGESWGCLDFGRGKWPYRAKWNWGAGAGIVDGRTIGLQLGGKWTDGTGMTENALVVDGRLSKLSEELVWTYDLAHPLEPWRIRTPRSKRLDVTFTPIYDKPTRIQAGIAASSVDQCFGTYAGTIVPDGGEAIEVDGVFGWAEEATWRW